jgi:hypothetical protein
MYLEEEERTGFAPGYDGTVPAVLEQSEITTLGIAVLEGTRPPRMPSASLRF